MYFKYIYQHLSRVRLNKKNNYCINDVKYSEID